MGKSRISVSFCITVYCNLYIVYCSCIVVIVITLYVWWLVVSPALKTALS